MKYNYWRIIGWFFRYLILSVWSLIILVPIIWVFISSFKPVDEVFKLSLPSRIVLENYIIPFTTRPYGRYYINSFIFASVATISNLFFCSLAGYGFAKFRFFARKVFFLLVLSTMMISIHVTMVPLFLIVKNLGWLNTFAGLLAPFMVTAFGVFLMRQNIINIPDDYIDAARLDGSSEFGIYFRVILPLSKPILATLGVLNFIAFWDEFLWPLVVATDTSTRTLTVGISLFITSYQSPVGQMFAVCVSAITPIMIAYFIAQKYFVRALTLTGLKE